MSPGRQACENRSRPALDPTACRGRRAAPEDAAADAPPVGDQRHAQSFRRLVHTPQGSISLDPRRTSPIVMTSPPGAATAPARPAIAARVHGTAADRRQRPPRLARQHRHPGAWAACPGARRRDDRLPAKSTPIRPARASPSAPGPARRAIPTRRPPSDIRVAPSSFGGVDHAVQKPIHCRTRRRCGLACPRHRGLGLSTVELAGLRLKSIETRGSSV